MAISRNRSELTNSERETTGYGIDAGPTALKHSFLGRHTDPCVLYSKGNLIGCFGTTVALNAAYWSGRGRLLGRPPPPGRRSLWEVVMLAFCTPRAERTTKARGIRSTGGGQEGGS
ncbi:hypothetical protein AAG570_011428 [Ranatra chinensis]|uniref:Uncharacterized protein n=1 Tax=Ranatra chinensis TaxID=642074 RepID=A0ABD0YKM4_9HEMI